ncbi:MAG: secretin N-terminal domain-containing protein [Acidobacteriota bacterium]
MTNSASMRWVMGFLAAVLLAGCTSFRDFRSAQVAELNGDWDQAVLHYLAAAANDPENLQYRASLLRAKGEASQMHFKTGKEARAAGSLERALVEYQQAVELDPTNQYAEVEMQRVRHDLEARARKEAGGEETLDQMKKKVRGARPQPPVLSPRSPQPISLSFPRPVSLFDIYRALGKAFGINIQFDGNLKDQQLAIELTDVTAQQALENLMRAAGHFYKVLDEHSILVAADTPQNRRTYEDLVIQTFFLSNAEVKDVMNQLRSLVDAKKLAPNEQLNAIIIRDTADKVKIAENIIESNDKARSEVVVDIELLQISTDKMREIGLALSNYSVTQKLDLGAKDAALHLSDLQFLNQGNWALTIPSFIYNFMKTNGDGQLLAQPRLRISEGETGKLVIADKIPVPVTSFNSSQTVGGNIVPVTSFQYLDVGIKIELKPRVHHNKEISLSLKIEVSNQNGSVDAGNGQQQPIIGTRNIESVIRLKDGETNFLAGLIRTEETGSKSGIAGLSEIPILGNIFSNTKRHKSRTDLILTLTPHIIRTPDITPEDLLPISVGTETNLTFRGSSPRIESDNEGPFDDDSQTPDVREMLRRRMEELPRGLQEGNAQDGDAAPAAKPAPPPDLATGKGPSDFFAAPAPPPAQPPADQTPPPNNGPAAYRSTPGGAGDTSRASGIVLASTADAASRGKDAAPPVVHLRLQNSPAEAGEEFEVGIEAEALRPVSHLPIALQFDPERLEVLRVEGGAFLGTAGQSQVLADFSRPGELLLGASRLGQLPGVTGKGEVARVTFRALVPGRTSLSWTIVRALDEQLKDIGAVDAPASAVTVRVKHPRPRDGGEAVKVPASEPPNGQ